MTTVTVTIGRNIGDKPMDDYTWHMFKHDTWLSVRTWSDELYVNGAEDDASLWKNVTETSATWVASVPTEKVPRILDCAAVLASYFDQDAIAVTIGDTVLVEGK